MRYSIPLPIPPKPSYPPHRIDHISKVCQICNISERELNFGDIGCYYELTF